jgi:hypothetical protein
MFRYLLVDHGRIFKANAAPVGTPWMWTLIFPHHEGRSPTHGYAESREAAMAAFAKSWRRHVTQRTSILKSRFL